MDYLGSTHRTVAWFKKADDDGVLQVAPSFQRNPVWLEPQKAFLIDSILREYPIPELYIQDQADANGVEKHIVVDGQQRIRAFLEFAAGEFSLDAEYSPEYGSVAFGHLPEAAKIKFFNYRFVVRTLPDTPPDVLRGLFTRLNRNNVALNPQELRHATYWGPFIRLMEEIADLDFWPTSGVFTVNDFRRMLDVEYVSELAAGLLHGPMNKKDLLDDWYAAYEMEFEQSAEVERTFRVVTDELMQLMPDLARTRWAKKSDFYSLFLAAAKWTRRMPFARDERDAVRVALLGFATDVTAALRPDQPSDDEAVRTYAAAVARAASDLNNRVARIATMTNLIAAVVGEPPASNA